MARAQETNAHVKTVVETQLSYPELCARFEAAIGRLDLARAQALVTRSAPWGPDVEAAMGEMAGEAGLMLFATFDQGAVASLGGDPVRCRLYIVGNPAVAARIVRIDARGALYVPFRVAVYAGGVRAHAQPQPDIGRCALAADARL